MDCSRSISERIRVRARGALAVCTLTFGSFPEFPKNDAMMDSGAKPGPWRKKVQREVGAGPEAHPDGDLNFSRSPRYATTPTLRLTEGDRTIDGFAFFIPVPDYISHPNSDSSDTLDYPVTCQTTVNKNRSRYDKSVSDINSI
ncbi:hypothetical protein EDB89DRAFT_1905052 [Lactarius sanguifluus]|nr:hypothetical protein EDB89DRAFT_1905052 [Lactarius sanguifluus]